MLFCVLIAQFRSRGGLSHSSRVMASKATRSSPCHFLATKVISSRVYVSLSVSILKYLESLLLSEVSISMSSLSNTELYSESADDFTYMKSLGLESNISTAAAEKVFYYHHDLKHWNASFPILVLIHGYPQSYVLRYLRILILCNDP